MNLWRAERKEAGVDVVAQQHGISALSSTLPSNTRRAISVHREKRIGD